MLTLSPYADTAYRSDRIPRQPAPKAKPKMPVTMYQTAIRLPWGNTEPVILLNLIEDGNPLLLAKTEKEFYKEGAIN